MDEPSPGPGVVRFLSASFAVSARRSVRADDDLAELACPVLDSDVVRPFRRAV